MANSLVVYVCLITNTFVRLGEAEKKLRYFVEDMDSSCIIFYHQLFCRSTYACIDLSHPQIDNKNHNAEKQQ